MMNLKYKQKGGNHMKSNCLDTNIILEKKEVNKNEINKISLYCFIEVLCNENFASTHIEYIKKNQIKIIKPFDKNIKDIKLDEEEKKALLILSDFPQLEENLKNNKKKFLEKVRNIKIKIYSYWTYWIIFYYLKELILNLSFEFYKYIPNMSNNDDFKKEICDIEKLTNKKWSEIWKSHSLSELRKDFKCGKYKEHRSKEYEDKICLMIRDREENIFEQNIFKEKINKVIDDYFQLFEKYHSYPLIEENIFKDKDVYSKFCKKYKSLFKKYVKLAKKDYLYEYFKHWQNCLEMYSISSSYYSQLLFFAIPFYILERKIENRKIERNDIFDILILSSIELNDDVKSNEKNLNIFLKNNIPLIREVWNELTYERRL